jgi:hypothetical protein
MEFRVEDDTKKTYNTGVSTPKIEGIQYYKRFKWGGRVHDFPQDCRSTESDLMPDMALVAVW